MSPPGRVLVVGEALATFMGYPDDPPLHFHGPFLSGAPVIFASAAARLGARVALVTGVGQDVFGDQFRERLIRDGVAREGIVTDTTRPTSCAFVRYQADGRRSYIFYVEGTASLSVGPEVLGRVGRADWLHVSGATLAFGDAIAETAWAAVERSISAGIPISFDPNVRADSLPPVTSSRVARLLDVARVVLASAGELEALGVSERRILDRGGILCHKAGAEGARVLVGDATWSVPAPAVRAVDPDGAGDIFAAGFVVALLAGADPAASAAVGVRVASTSVAVRGPLESRIDPLPIYLGDPG